MHLFEPYNATDVVRSALKRGLRRAVHGDSRNAEHVASLLVGLQQRHPDIVQEVIEDTLERLLGVARLPEPGSVSSQKRIADARFVGELYAYSLVDSKIVFRVCITMLNTGHRLPDTALRDRMCALGVEPDAARVRAPRDPGRGYLGYHPAFPACFDGRSVSLPDGRSAPPGHVWA